MSTSQSFGENVVPGAVGREDSPDPDDVPIVDLGESREPDPAYEDDVAVGTAKPDPAYKDDVPVGTADADEDARRTGGSR
jgi:hypothetical protein